MLTDEENLVGEVVKWILEAEKSQLPRQFHAKTIIDLVRGSEWVSVDERLPEENTDVLCTQYAYMDENKGRYQMVGFRIDDEWFSSSIDDEPESCFTPTHWMPLPSPPTNKGE